MSSNSDQLPQQADLKRLPRWARVVLLARTVRRILPLAVAGWPAAPRKFYAAIEGALVEGERAAAQGAQTPDLEEAGMAAMEFYGEAPLEGSPVGGAEDEVPFAASRVSFAARESDGLLAAGGLRSAAFAVWHFAKFRKTPELCDQFAALIWEDLRFLEAAAKAGKWKSKTPVSMDIFGPLWPSGPPAGWPDMVAPAKRPKAKPARTTLDEMRLPADLVAFLKGKKKLKYNVNATEVGPIKLKPLDHLKLTAFDVMTEDTPHHADDPNRKRKGAYQVRAVDLVAECDAYGPDGILAWLPDDQAFGAWDPDHLRLVIFPSTTWTQIAKSPAIYLDAQWGDHEEFAEHIKPWLHGRFVAATK